MKKEYPMKGVSELMPLSGKDLRDAILSLLTDKWPLSARDIHGHIRKDYKIDITYQGVHKALRQMNSEGLLASRDGKYLIDLSWARKVTAFGRKIECSYKSDLKDVPLLEVGAGSSAEKDAFEAGKEAARKALRNIRFNTKHQLVLVFCSSSYDGHFDRLLKGIRSITGRTPLAGCTSLGGEIFNGPLSKSIVVSVFSSDSGTFSAVTTSIEVPPSAYEGKAKELRKAVEKLEVPSSERNGFGIVLFPGYSQANKMRIIVPLAMPMLAEACGKNFPVIGGIAGDDWKFNRTVLFRDDAVSEESIVFVKVKTTLPFAIRNTHGYSPKNKSKYVIKQDKQGVVTHLTKKTDERKHLPTPALKAYCSEVGLREKQLREYLPCFIKETISMNRTPPLMSEDRNILAFPISLNGPGMVFEDVFHNGDIVQVAHTSPDKLVERVRSLINEMTSVPHFKRPACVLLFPCAIFEAILSRSGKDEIREARSCLPKEAPIVGFYCAGEIGENAFPLANGTVSALVIGSTEA